MHPVKTTFLQPRGEGRAAGCWKAGAASSHCPLLRGDVWLPLAPPKHSPGALLSLSMPGGDGGFRGPTPVAPTGPQREAGVGDSRPPLPPPSSPSQPSPPPARRSALSATGGLSAVPRGKRKPLTPGPGCNGVKQSPTAPLSDRQHRRGARSPGWGGEEIASPTVRTRLRRGVPGWGCSPDRQTDKELTGGEKKRPYTPHPDLGIAAGSAEATDFGAYFVLVLFCGGFLFCFLIVLISFFFFSPSGALSRRTSRTRVGCRQPRPGPACG